MRRKSCWWRGAVSGDGVITKIFTTPLQKMTWLYSICREFIGLLINTKDWMMITWPAATISACQKSEHSTLLWYAVFPHRTFPIDGIFSIHGTFWVHTIFPIHEKFSVHGTFSIHGTCFEMSSSIHGVLLIHESFSVHLWNVIGAWYLAYIICRGTMCPVSIQKCGINENDLVICLIKVLPPVFIYYYYFLFNLKLKWHACWICRF